MPSRPIAKPPIAAAPIANAPTARAPVEVAGRAAGLKSEIDRLAIAVNRSATRLRIP